MSAPKPHYLLFCDGNYSVNNEAAASNRGRWRFVLENVESGERIEATDTETSSQPDRTALLSVSRGLEALEQPSKVTLVTSSRYVARGLQYGLVEWRENDYCWEHFGSVQPIRNADLWRRIDRALQFHQVQCRSMSHEAAPASESPELPTTKAMDSTEPAAKIGEALETVIETIPAKKTSKQSKKKSSSRLRSCTIQEANAPTKKDFYFYPDSGASPNVAESSRAAVAAIAVESPAIVQPESAMPPLRSKRRWIILSPFCWIWSQILRLDGYLESYLRCLFLLDPRREQFRSRNFSD